MTSDIPHSRYRIGSSTSTSRWTVAWSATVARSRIGTGASLGSCSALNWTNTVIRPPSINRSRAARRNVCSNNPRRRPLEIEISGILSSRRQAIKSNDGDCDDNGQEQQILHRCLSSTRFFMRRAFFLHDKTIPYSPKLEQVLQK